MLTTMKLSGALAGTDLVVWLTEILGVELSPTGSDSWKGTSYGGTQYLLASHDEERGSFILRCVRDEFHAMHKDERRTQGNTEDFVGWLTRALKRRAPSIHIERLERE